MKVIIFALMLLTGCGGDDSGDSAQQEPAPAATQTAETPAPAALDVTRINLELDCPSYDDMCRAEITYEITGGSTPFLTGQKLIAAISEKAAPAACDHTSLADDLIIFTDLKPETKYFIRGCLFDKAAATYSPGMVIEITTPANA